MAKIKMMYRMTIVISLIILLSLVGIGILLRKPVIYRGVNVGSLKSSSEITDRVLDSVNRWRVSNGVQELEKHKGLCGLAFVRAYESSRDFSHSKWSERADNGELWEWCPECGWMGENLIQRYSKSDEIVEAWANSPGHRSVMITPLRYGCVGYYYKYDTKVPYTSLIVGEDR